MAILIPNQGKPMRRQWKWEVQESNSLGVFQEAGALGLGDWTSRDIKDIGQNSDQKVWSRFGPFSARGGGGWQGDLPSPMRRCLVADFAPNA